MLTPSKKVFYAIEAVLFIAYNAKAAPISGTQVSAAQNLPMRYLESIMQKLVRAGILRGVRGPTGGYMLGRERRRITLADICAGVTDDGALPETKTALGKKILAPTATVLMQKWQAQLSDVTLADLCDRAADANIATANETATDFTI